jgi:DNA (cytosine-5)-methyltransferase 1
MELKVGSDFSGVGAFDVAISQLCNYTKVFSCDMDKFARRNYLANFGTEADLKLLNQKDVKLIDSVYYRHYNSTKKPTEEEMAKAEVLAEKYSKQFSFYYPWDVYHREIPKESLDIYMTSPPCQAFSLAGNRLGKEDTRGVLFFNSLEFIRENKPKTFIFENVEGLVSHDKSNKKQKYGKTFTEWINYLGGCSVNGVPTVFPYEDSVPYHIFFTFLNAKQHNVPQNRKRIFIVGIRQDISYSNFQWPQTEPLTRKLKDVLESEVDEKYFLSMKMVKYLIGRSDNFNSGKVNYKTEEDIASTITKSSSSIDISDNIIVMGNVNPSGKGMNGNVFDENGLSPTLNTNKGEGIKIGTWRTHKDGEGFRECEDGTCPTIPARAREDGSGQPVIAIKSNTQKGYEEATNEDSINFSNPHSKTRRGRVGKGVAQTLDTSCNQGVIVPDSKILGYTRDSKGKVTKRHVKDEAGTITTASGGGGNTDQFVCIPVLTPDRAEKRQNGRRFKEDGEEMFTITAQDNHGIYNGFTIRRLTPLECFRLMDFPDSHVENARKVGISDSQLYKQAGNSIVAKKLKLICKKILQIINHENVY